MQQIALASTQSEGSSIPDAGDRVKQASKKRSHSPDREKKKKKRKRHKHSPNAEPEKAASDARDRSRSQRRRKSQSRKGNKGSSRGAEPPWAPAAARATPGGWASACEAQAPSPVAVATATANEVGAALPPSLSLQPAVGDTENQILAWVLRVGGLTPDTLGVWASAVGGCGKMRIYLERIAEGQLRVAAPWVAGASWCIAFALSLKDWCDQAQFNTIVASIASTGGNALESFDRVAEARFSQPFHEPRSVLSTGHRHRTSWVP